MENVKNIATYIISRYRKDYGDYIDEMKLHKLLYFAQRESLVQLNYPLFPETFYAWKYGPVMPEIRNLYKFHLLPGENDEEIDPVYIPVLDKVFSQYAFKSSWSLSRLTHGELSWQNARKGIDDTTTIGRQLSLDDIRVDANRIKLRRYVLEHMQNPS